MMYSIEEPNFESMGSVNSSMVRYVLPDVGYEDATGETHYEIKDHLGNLRVSYTLEWCATCGTACLDQTVEYRIDYVADYFAYGGIMREYIRLNTEQERFLSTGNERDKPTGWDYRNARYYDSDIGRFLGVDELAVHPFQIDKSPYSGMWSNPISWTDPSGLCPTCPTAADEGATHEWAGLKFTFQYGYWSTTLSEATFTKKSDEGAYSIDYVANWVNSNNALSFQNANGGIDGGFGRGGLEAQGAGGGPSGYDYLSSGFLGGVSTMLGGAENSYKWTPKDLRRKWSYQISKIKGAPKSGQIYQGWKQISKTSSAWGTRLGFAGAILSTGDYISNYDKASVGKHTNYWLSITLFSLSVFPPTAPVFAPVGFVYGASQFGTFIGTGRSLEENLIDP